MKTECSRPGCPNTRTSGFFKARDQDWIFHEAAWYCSRKCQAETIAARIMEHHRHDTRVPPRQLKLGLLLLKNNLIEADKLKIALEQQSRSGRKLGEILVEAGHITEKDLLQGLALQAGLAPISLDTGLDIKPRDLIPAALLQAYPAVVFQYDETDRTIAAAVYAPTVIPALTEFFQQLHPGWHLRFFLEERRRITEILSRNFPHEKWTMPPLSGAEYLTTEAPVEATVVRFIEFLKSLGATNVHLESADETVWLQAELERLQIDTYFKRK
jgi:hypothetical protein